MNPTLQRCALILAAVLWASAAWGGKVHPELEQQLKGRPAAEKIPVIVEMREQARPAEVLSSLPEGNRKEKLKALVRGLRAASERAQSDVRGELAREHARGAVERVTAFWVFNGLAVTASEPVIRRLAARADVLEVRPDAQIPLPARPAAGTASAGAAEWNIALVRAPEVWALHPTYDGAGAVVGSFDTGVDYTHPELAASYRGVHATSWFDPYGEHATPTDFHGHGTHTTGTAVGGSAGGSHIGVAPGARWIAAKAWNDAGVGFASAFHQIFEWFLAPGGDPDNAPDVVINSWSLVSAGCDPEFAADVQAWRAAGIFPAFAAGNQGSLAGSVRTPGAYPEAFTVGATDAADEVAFFSGRGPSPCDGSVKPNVSAPGVDVLSSVPGGYGVLSGTSMATPHVAGAAALLRAIDPGISVERMEAVLASGALDLAPPNADNATGAGRIDLFASAQMALLGPDFPVVKVVASSATATEAGPVPGAFTVSRIGGTDAPLQVQLAVSGSAAPGVDYEPLPASVTIPAGSPSVALAVTPVDDALAELNETVVLALSRDPSYIVSGSSSATVTLISNEVLPDLSVSLFSAPASGGAGQGVTVSDTTKNQGGGTAEASQTYFYLSANSALDGADLLLGSREVPALAAGATSAGSTLVAIPAGTATGAWFLMAKADGPGLVPETQESNNVMTRSIYVGPDLTVSALTAPGTAGPGQAVTVGDTTKNQGGGGAEASLTQIYLSSNSSWDASDLLLGSRAVPALAAGATNAGSTLVTIPAGTAAGTWYLIARADGPGALPETFESNNTMLRSIQVTAQ